MDEPFAALDAQRRVTLQSELLSIKEQTGISIVFVTHDLDEAITMADRIYVFGHGPAARIKSSYDVSFEHPRNIQDMRGDSRYAELWACLWRDLSADFADSEV
jgi:NitT/TauT family transport system ATP-binding protein